MQFGSSLILGPAPPGRSFQSFCLGDEFMTSLFPSERHGLVFFEVFALSELLPLHLRVQALNRSCVFQTHSLCIQRNNKGCLWFLVVYNNGKAAGISPACWNSFVICALRRQYFTRSSAGLNKEVQLWNESLSTCSLTISVLTRIGCSFEELVGLDVAALFLFCACIY